MDVFIEDFENGAQIYITSFRKNKPKTLVLNH
jgi:hypothetical protein